MKEHPIIFSTEMVRAIMGGRKTMTRRIVKNPVSQISDLVYYGKCPYGEIGDTLWVRERFRHNDQQTGYPYQYYANNEDFTDPDNERWKPSIHMPRSAARIFLKIKDIRVERLNEISEADAMREGDINQGLIASENTHIDWFKSIWESIHGKGSWESNPFVWVISFEQTTPPQVAE